MQSEKFASMEDYSVIVAGLEYKVRQLIERKNSLQAEMDEMKRQLDTLRQSNEQLNQQFQEVSKSKQLLEISTAVENTGDSRKVKLLINNYIREIDRCIAYLNSN